MQHFIPFTSQQCQQITSLRDGETKLAQTVHCCDTKASLDDTFARAQNNHVRFVIIGIGEDIGPRANLGRGGATDAFESAMAQFLNLQSNRFLSGKECLVLGQIETRDLQLPEGIDADTLRKNVERLDERVISLVSQVMAAGFGWWLCVLGLVVPMGVRAGALPARPGPDHGSNFYLLAGVESIVYTNPADLKLILLGNLAIRAGRKLEWDGPNMKVTNVPEANQYVRREYRKGWSL